jgi:hypothetical protein
MSVALTATAALFTAQVNEGRPAKIAEAASTFCTQMLAIPLAISASFPAEFTAAANEGRPAVIAQLLLDLSDEIELIATYDTAVYTAALTKDVNEGRPATIATNAAALCAYVSGKNP